MATYFRPLNCVYKLFVSEVQLVGTMFPGWPVMLVYCGILKLLKYSTFWCFVVFSQENIWLNFDKKMVEAKIERFENHLATLAISKSRKRFETSKPARIAPGQSRSPCQSTWQRRAPAWRSASCTTRGPAALGIASSSIRRTTQQEKMLYIKPMNNKKNNKE
jgi:hypothetical protein